VDGLDLYPDGGVKEAFEDWSSPLKANIPVALIKRVEGCVLFDDDIWSAGL